MTRLVRQKPDHLIEIWELHNSMAAKEWLLRIFSKHQIKNWEQTNEPISTQKTIVQVLSKLADQQAYCSVKLPAQVDSVPGVVRSLNKQEYLLDVTLDCSEVPKPGTNLSIYCRVNGSDTHFQSAVSSVNGKTIKIEIPDAIYHVTRRQNERVILTPVGTAKLTVAHPLGNLEGTLFDLSTGGIGGIVKTEAALATNEQYTCFLEFPDKSRLMTRMSVVHVHDDPKPGYVRLGLAFAELSSDEADTIRQILND